jgi:hypothetical protein
MAWIMMALQEIIRTFTSWSNKGLHTYEYLTY